MLPVRLLGAEDRAMLARVAPGVFDKPVDPQLLEEFLTDARHHLAVATDGDLVVGMASAVHYVHPDKRPQLFINEVGVSDGYRRRGLARRLIQALIDHGRQLECTEAWVLSDADNHVARALYKASGASEAVQPSIMYTFHIDLPARKP